MNAAITLERIRDLARAKMLEVPPFAGEEMNLPQTDSHRDGFIDGERTLAAQILALLDEQPQHAYGVAAQLFSHRWDNSEGRRMAVAETLSHLEHMRLGGQVEQHKTSDGLLLYSVA